MHLNALYDFDFLLVEPAAAAAQSSLTSDTVDMAGYDSIAFVAVLGDVSDTSVLTLTGRMGDDSGGGDQADLASPVTFTAGATDADSKLMVLDLHRPSSRYVSCTLDRGTANAAVNGILAIRYNAHERKNTIDTTEVIASGFINDPQLA